MRRLTTDSDVLLACAKMRLWDSPETDRRDLAEFQKSRRIRAAGKGCPQSISGLGV